MNSVANEEIIELKEIVDLDPHGFLKCPEKWDKGFAVWMAKKEGLEKLTKQQWQAIYFVRRHYEDYDQAPRTKEIAQAVGIKLNEFIDFFPPRADVLIKIAGLPGSKICSC